MPTQKWEYLWVEVVDGRVHIVNNEIQKRIPTGLTGIFATKEDFELAHVFLNRMGQEGWELVGITLASNHEYISNKSLVLKRPTP